MTRIPLSTNCSRALTTSKTAIGILCRFSRPKIDHARSSFLNRPGIPLQTQGVRPTPDRSNRLGHPQTGREWAQGLRHTELLLEPGEREKVFAELGREETDETLASMVAFAYLGFEDDRHRFETCLDMASSRGRTFANSPNQLVGRPTRTCLSRSSTTPISRRCISVSRTVRS